MDWGLVRDQYPDKLVLVEALSTTSKDSIRTVEEMSIIATFDNNMEAWKAYKKTHKENPGKELYVFHTSKEKPEVIENFLLGYEDEDGVKRRRRSFTSQCGIRV